MNRDECDWLVFTWLLCGKSHPGQVFDELCGRLLADYINGVNQYAR